ncbi:MAG: efflux RND transporter periplasmic adaptor subunit [Bacteroidetes bacterium]|nr:efflux RND transporter periplasmic adaptor subunit [Bacteroidota bacterium]
MENNIKNCSLFPTSFNKLKRIIHFQIPTLLIITIAMMGCGTAPEVVQESEITHHLIIVTKEQYKGEQMQMGEVQSHLFEEIVKTNGRIVASSDGMAEVNTFIPGIVKSLKLMVGDYVNKGQLLCSIESNEVIIIQQEFKELSASLKSLKADYDRMTILIRENIASQKEFVTIESAYHSALAKYSGLKSRLELLNLYSDKLEAGEITSTFNIHAPISGYISKQNCTLGQSIDPQNTLMEIVDINKLHLQLYIYEKDILKLNKGQTLRFYSPHLSDKIFTATLSQTGRSIDPETKTIECIAKIAKGDAEPFVNGMFMMVEVVSNQFEAMALPNDALLKSGDDFYILVKEKEDAENYYFKQIIVKTGITQNGFTQIELKEEAPQILIKGLYNLQLN